MWLKKLIKPASANLYVITAHKFNHLDRPAEIDPRFFDPYLNSTFYFVDKDGAPSGFGGRRIEECRINPQISDLGSKFLAEWSFLLTEHKFRFAEYPFYMVSSRFFEKNTRLTNKLTEIWDIATLSLSRYGYGYLPSYDRDPNFQDLSEYLEKGRLGMKMDGIAFIDGFYGVRMVDEYRFISDFFCNYIGFRSRVELEGYVKFYLPFIRRFITDKGHLRRDPEIYVRRRDVFRAEKPFTFLLELISHLFFYANRVPFGGLSYDGLYDVREWEGRMLHVCDFQSSESNTHRVIEANSPSLL